VSRTRAASPLLCLPVETDMADEEMDDMIVVPMPSSETEEEHDRIRASNDRDQELEREGKPSKHNAGYDQAADGTPAPTIERVVDNEE
jgi:hypothetical protein